jgi:hypothetical protein
MDLSSTNKVRELMFDTNNSYFFFPSTLIDFHALYNRFQSLFRGTVVSGSQLQQFAALDRCQPCSSALGVALVDFSYLLQFPLGPRPRLRVFTGPVSDLPGS